MKPKQFVRIISCANALWFQCQCFPYPCSHCKRCIYRTELEIVKKNKMRLSALWFLWFVSVIWNNESYTLESTNSWENWFEPRGLLDAITSGFWWCFPGFRHAFRHACLINPSQKHAQAKWFLCCSYYTYSPCRVRMQLFTTYHGSPVPLPSSDLSEIINEHMCHQ